MSDMTDRAKAISRVVKMAEITVERGASAGEADAVRGRALRLISKHGITESELRSAAARSEVAARPRRTAEQPASQPSPPPSKTQWSPQPPPSPWCYATPIHATVNVTGVNAGVVRPYGFVFFVS